MKKLMIITVALFASLTLSSTAWSYVVQQDGLGVDVSYVTTGQTATFTYTADFTGDDANNWIGQTMDSFSVQFGSGSDTALIDSWSATASTSANLSGAWTGMEGKVSGGGGSNAGCAGGFEGAICYTVLPTGSGADDATVIAKEVYEWVFDVTFGDGFDVSDVLAGSHSIKFFSMKLNGNGSWTTGNQLSQSGSFCERECTEVPEPATLALLGLGLAGLRLARKRS